MVQDRLVRGNGDRRQRAMVDSAILWQRIRMHVRAICYTPYSTYVSMNSKLGGGKTREGSC